MRHITNTQAAIGLIGAIIGGILLIWASLRNKYGKPAHRPGDSPALREPFPPLTLAEFSAKVKLGERTEEFPPVRTYEPMSHDGEAPGAVAPAPPPKAASKKSLTKTPKRVSAKRPTTAKR
jgi:hypothetical protein